MLRRWGILLAMLTLAAGMALTARSASAATMGFRPGGPIHLVGANRTVHGGISHQAESTNWSGYAATTGTYTSVSASWTEPSGICSRGSQYSSFWVGIDGYTSSSVEQTGTDSDCIGGSPTYYAWFEFYPHPSRTISSMTIHPGDYITAQVSFASSKFTVKITDLNSSHQVT